MCLEALEGIFENVYISSERGFTYKDYKIVWDMEDHRGPLGTLRFEGFVFTPVDMPFVKRETFAEIRTLLFKCDAVCLSVGGKLSMPIGLRRKNFINVRRFICEGKISLFGFIKTLKPFVLRKPHTREFLNINTQNDLPTFYLPKSIL